MPDEPLLRFSKSYPPGAVIFREGDEGSEMYILQKGKVRVSKSFAGKLHVIAVLQKGDFFGEMAIVNLIKRTATVTAIEAVEVLAFDREGLVNMITKNARIGLSIIDKLCRRLQMANLNVQHLVKKDEMGLIALHLHHLFQALPDAETALPYQETLDDISLDLELPRENVEAVLQRIATAGIIKRAGDAIELVEREKLFTLAE
jgi:CRP/FNR family cyclic AMP-dependent transcriptional regulator